MKPEYLEIQGFGVFTDKICIDFTSLGSGIFLINGNTGSGKTTIFDAITYALYGKPSGSIRDESNFRNNSISSDMDTIVKLIFTHKGRRYTAERTISINTKSQKKPVKLNAVITDGETGNILAESTNTSKVCGRNEVNTFVQNLIGIDVNEFRQIIMIAQGEFMSFLTAKNPEKEAILRKIFATKKYENIEKRLLERRKAYEQERNNFSLKAGELIMNVSYDGYDCEYISRYKQTNGAGQFAGFDEIISEINGVIESDKAKFDDISLRSDKNSALKEELVKKIEKARADNEILFRLSDTNKKLSELEAQKDEMALLSQRLEKYDYILKNIMPYQNEYLRLSKEKKSAENELEKISGDYDICIREYGSAKAEEEKLIPLNKDKDRLTVEISEIKKSFELYETAQKLEDEIKKLEKGLKELEGQIKDDERLFSDGKTKTDTLKEELSKYENADAEFVTAMQQKTDNEKRIKDILGSEKILSDAEKYKKVLSKRKQELKQKEEIFKSIERKFLKSHASIIASELNDGDICPVCGGQYHSHKIAPQGEADTEAYNAAKKERDDIKAKADSGEIYTSEKMQELKRTVKEIFNIDIDTAEQARIIINDEKAKAQNELDNANERFEICSQAMKRKKNISADLETLSKNDALLDKRINENKIKYAGDLQSVQGKKADCVKTRRTLKFKSLSEAEKDAEQKENSLKNVISSIELITKRISETGERLAYQKSLFESKQKNLKEITEKAEDSYKEYKNAAEGSVFGDIEEYEKFDNLTEASASLARKRITDFNTEKSSLEAAKTALEKSVGSNEITDIEKLESQKNEISGVLSGLDKQKTLLSGSISKNEEIPVRLQELKKEYDKSAQYYDAVNELCNAAGGGRKKISFENYIQSYYFKNVILHASQRLLNMTDGRYILKPKFDPESNSQTAGLDIVVYDYESDTQRDINTLSGGESFEAALCLALGFSDVVQARTGGIDIDAMYIDEGFGTLDESLLERAVNVLETITGSSRIIGVISHRPELGERIRNKITVTKKDKKSTVSIQTH